MARFACPYKGCGKTFALYVFFRRHIAWHKSQGEK